SHLIDWLGNEWTPDSDKPAAHPNSRFTTPITQCPILADEFENPQGVPIDIILFGGRRSDTIPLVTQARDWDHGVYMGATCSSATTAAAAGAVGVVRRDPMAMLPFLGYHVGDYLQHWYNMGAKEGANMPAVFYVNWFRRGEDGRFLWPGFGDNSRVLKWAIDRIEGNVSGQETPIGIIPAEGELDVSGLTEDPADIAAATAFVPEEWQAELPLIQEWFDKIGDKLPAKLNDELKGLTERLG
ncbi:MAG: phosphoenolpyruvate carboxykinase (GTP), partial [Propionibacterium sp.]|nr:phosphoenolpyruvate carboxykinase (GTP) [Propionibacterium sp.]